MLFLKNKIPTTRYIVKKFYLVYWILFDFFAALMGEYIITKLLL